MPEKKDISEFDRCEVYTDVHVQVLMNTKTGKSSIGWTRDMNTVEDWIRHAHAVNRKPRRAKRQNGNDA